MWGAAVKIGYETGNRNRKLTKLFRILPFECEITHANFGGDRTTFVKVMVKKLMHPGSHSREFLFYEVCAWATMSDIAIC